MRFLFICLFFIWYNTINIDLKIIKEDWINLDMKELESFAYKLNRLGGKNTFKQTIIDEVVTTPFIDIEIFILEGTVILKKMNSKLFKTFAYWLKEFGHLISPSKLHKLIKLKKVKHDPQVLLGIIYFVQAYSDIGLVNRNKENGFHGVIKLCQKKFTELKVFDRPSKYGSDEAWGKARLEIPKFKLDEEHKYLQSKKRIFETIKEIQYRMIGLSANQSETLICIEHRIFLPSEVARITLSDYGNSYRRIKLFHFMNI